jgi:hypothetical protein
MNSCISSKIFPFLMKVHIEMLGLDEFPRKVPVLNLVFSKLLSMHGKFPSQQCTKHNGKNTDSIKHAHT